MKTLLWLCAALLLAGGSHAQLISPDLVPPLAFVALQQQYPHATKVQWKKTQGLYQASFNQDQDQQFIRFSDNGDVESTGASLALSALPASVRHTLVAHYPSRKVCQAAKFVNARTEAITYEAATCKTRSTTSQPIRRSRPLPAPSKSTSSSCCRSPTCRSHWPPRHFT